MADNPEVSQWEPGIYQLETIDDVVAGLGGISNRSNVELGNRTAAVKTALDNNGVYVVGGEHTFTGQNIDATAVFEGSVVNGNCVWYDASQNRYEKFVSGQQPAGFADVTNGRVVSGGMMLLALPSVVSSGDVYYASDSVPGAITKVAQTNAMGKVLWLESPSTGILHILPSMNNTGPAINHSDLNQDQSTQHFLESAVRHSVLNNDEPSIHTGLGDLIGHITFFVTGNSAPINYLHCNGALISKTTYANLYSGMPFSIGNRFGESGGSFYLPDFRGRVPRGWANGSSRDPDRASRFADTGGITGDNPGSMQNDELDSHRHAPSAGYSNFMSTSGSGVGSGGDNYGRMDYTGYFGGNETRMKNFGAMWIVRYQ